MKRELAKVTEFLTNEQKGINARTLLELAELVRPIAEFVNAATSPDEFAASLPADIFRGLNAHQRSFVFGAFSAHVASYLKDVIARFVDCPREMLDVIGLDAALVGLRSVAEAEEAREKAQGSIEGCPIDVPAGR